MGGGRTVFRFEFQEQGTFWLNICNAALGIAVIAGLCAVIFSAVRSALHRHTPHVHPARH
jgi:hypothetical protein